VLDHFLYQTTNAAGVPITDQTCLIMDEVDGMSAGDRGGVGALNALIKKTKVGIFCVFSPKVASDTSLQIPIICIANDRGAQKLKPLMASTYSLTFRK
jgi:replication factor C subunit 1